MRTCIFGSPLWAYSRRLLCRHSSTSPVVYCKTLEVNLADHSNTRLVQERVAALLPGMLRLRVESFAVTANTVTYATVGEKFGYWNFYPSSDPTQWGRVPAIGWATVVESSAEFVAAGERYFGWFPMSDYVTMPVLQRNCGFRDVGAHRVKHAPVYVDFTRTDVDPYYVDNSRDGEDRQALLRGLFLTSFLADEFLYDQRYFGAQTIVIVSASSKTAMGLAHRLSLKKASLGIEVVGVTSPGNIEFVSASGYYDTTVSYSSIESILNAEKSIIIDMSGNRTVITNLHAHLGEALQYSMAIGFSHHQSAGAPQDGNTPRGPAPTLFFAPSEVVRRTHEWGVDGYHSRAQEALRLFIVDSKKWMAIDHARGPKAAQDAWAIVQSGSCAPDRGIISSMHEA